ncbi:MAG: TonB-dependent receptor [Myxococcota bacterium]|nr:TonB-dependent receptor [Myxococcota bacterium]
MRPRLALLIGLGVLVVSFAPPPAWPQQEESTPQTGDPPAEPEPAEPPDSGIEEIVVLGAESESAADFQTGDSVVGFGAEDLAALGAQDIADIAGFTPNLEIVTSGSTTPTFFIRGVGLNDFNANSTGAVAIYQDDVAINAPALQLGTLFDVEAVNVLRGPQGTGLARNASAGAIKIYSRKPTGEFGGFLRSELGDFHFRDFEGAIEAPIYEDMLAGRFAFRYSEREGTMKNRCGGAPEYEDRAVVLPAVNPVNPQLSLIGQGKTDRDAPWSQCGEPVLFAFDDPSGGTDPLEQFNPDNWTGRSLVPAGLPKQVNDINNWAARGQVLFQPTLDAAILLNAHGSKRDELTRHGQSYGTNGFFDDEEGNRIQGLFGAQQGIPAGYQPPEVRARYIELAPCLAQEPGAPFGTCTTPEEMAEVNRAKQIVAAELADQPLDDEPWEGDFNICSARADVDGNLDNGVQCPPDSGKTKNDTWGVFLKADVALPAGMEFTAISGYDSYDRLIDTDLDFSPETLFHIRTDDDGWQFTTDLRLQGQLGDETPVRWDIGAYFLREELNVEIRNDLGNASAFAVGLRDYTQDLWSAAGYFQVSYDFWKKFTLDGGVRFNWERKTLDYSLTITQEEFQQNLKDDWWAPTGTIRLTYRFREDTHVYWKYTRGWKPGTYNATSNVLTPFDGGDRFVNLSVADPEFIDAYETGMRGSWLEGRVGLDLSFFYYDYGDYQLFTAQQFAVAGTGAPEFVILNADGAEVYGAEIDLVARPWLGAFANVRFGWLESQFLDFVQTQQELLSGQRVINRELQNTGNRLLNSPRFKVSLTAEQTLPLGRWGSFTVRYDGTWTDQTFYDPTESRGIPNQQGVQFLPEDAIGQPQFWLHNLRVSYRLPGGQIELAGWIRNISDTPYKTFAFDGSTFNRTTIHFVGDPRTVGGTLVVNF